MSSALFFVVNSKARETRVHAKMSFCEGGDERREARGRGGGRRNLFLLVCFACFTITNKNEECS